MTNGWIKIHRSILTHWVHSCPEYYAAWIDILMVTNHEPDKVLIKGELIDCGRGQSVRSLEIWVDLFGKWWTIQKVRTFFLLLEKDNMIALEGMRKSTRLTVCNYERYQDCQQADNKQTTSRQQADNKQITTNKKDKNDKKINKVSSVDVKHVSKVDCIKVNNNKLHGNKVFNNDDKVVNNIINNDVAVRFVTPTLAEVIAYCRERNSPVDPETFWDKGQSTGWVDKYGNKYKDWKAALRTWEKWAKKGPNLGGGAVNTLTDAQKRNLARIEQSVGGLKDGQANLFTGH